MENSVNRSLSSAQSNLNSASASRQGISAEILEDRHRRVLVDESGIDPGVIAARGYWTATKKTQLTGAPGYIQRGVPALVMPTFSPDGETESFQTRPDKAPVLNGKRSKYLSVKPTVIDVHPAMRDAVCHGVGELWITEGIKKADALTSHGLPTIGLAGVWMWNRPGVRPYELLPCFDYVALHGRTVNVVYDSDVMVKEGVQLALTALVTALEGRGAVVRVVYLPDAADGSKLGIDDWFVNGGTVAELAEMPRSFEPADFVRARLSRDERLRSAIEAVRREWEAMPAKRTRDCTDRAVMKDFLQTLERHGKIKDGELTVRRARSSVELNKRLSGGAVSKAWARLGDDGFIARPDKPDEKGTLFTFPGAGNALRDGEYRKTATEADVEGVALRDGKYRIALSKEFLSLLARISVYYRHAMPHFESGTSQVSQVPELRYPSLKVSRENGVKVYDYIARFGKKRGECIAFIEPYFLNSLEPLTVGDLRDVFGGPKTDARDFLRRFLGPMTGHRERGPLDHTEDDEPEPGDLLTGPPVIIIGDAHRVRDRTVTLTDNYLEAIEMHREIGGEIEANRLQEEKIRENRVAYRNRSKVKPDSAPTETEMDQRRARLHRERKARAVGTLVRKRSGPGINLGHYLAGNYKGAEFEGYFVNSVLQALGEPWSNANAWREAVLEAAEDQRGESVPETGAPAPGPAPAPVSEEKIPEKERNIHTMPDTGAVESPTTGAPEPSRGDVRPATTEPIHAVMCECDACIYPTPNYAKPKLLPGDSGRPRIAPLEPIPTYVNPGDSPDRRSAAA